MKLTKAMLDKVNGLGIFSKPVQTVQQGTVIAEKNDTGGWLVMTPDGCVEWARSKRSVEKIAKVWFAAHLNGHAVGVGLIEWRK